MIPKWLNAAGLVFATIAATAALLAAHPFDILNQGLDLAFGAPPKWAHVRNLFYDKTVQEVTRGEKPLESFSFLAEEWKSQPQAKRVVFIGNSQMMTASLARGEKPTNDPEKTWVDIIATEAREQTPPILVYRLSAPGLSYMEALFYLQYFISREALKPNLAVLQVNYQAFWQTGIREGMLELLRDTSFRKRIQTLSETDSSDAAIFREALEQWKKRGEPQPVAAKVSATETVGVGAALESGTRQLLDQWTSFRNRHEQKEETLDFLYRCRLYFLGLKPSTARSITGVRLERSQASLEAILQLCARNGIRVSLFDAPLNPQVQLYGSPDDQTAYESYLKSLKERYQVCVEPFSDSIPAEEWGQWFNGPDPLHLGRAAHHRLAKLMTPVLNRELTAP